MGRKLKYKYLLFDLDGTLTNSILGMINSIKYSIKKLDIGKSLEEEDFRFLVGSPLKDIFMKYFGLNEVKADRAIVYYREYFSTKGMYENSLYDGIESLLIKLKKIGKRLVIATAKPTVFTHKILQYFDIEKYFDSISGSDLKGVHTDKYSIIQNALKVIGNKDLKDVVMIGDAKYDIIGANKSGIDSIAVLYGYGGKEALENNPTYYVETVDGLGKIFGA